MFHLEGLSSIKPYNRSREIDAAQEGAGALVVAGGDSAVLLEFGKEVFDQVSGLIQAFIVSALFFAVRFGRNDGFDASFFQQGQNPFLRVVGFVGQERLNAGENVRQQGIRSLQIASLPRRQVKTRGVAKRIASGVDFRGQPAF